MEENEKTLAETLKTSLDLAKRHKFYLLIPFITVSLVSSIIAMKLPMAYVSKGTILIEQQQIPESMIRTTVTDFADERIRFIQQRIMTRERIFSIIDKYHLYAKEQDQLTPSELAEQFLDNVAVDLIGADVKNPQGGGAGKATIAFTVSFRSHDRTLTQPVANEIVSLFLAENSRLRTQRATKTTEFISEEAERVNRDIQGLENRIAEFKEKFGRSLPELLPANLSAVERVSGELRQTEGQINLLQDRITYLTAELPRARRDIPLQRDEKSPLSEGDLLRALKAEYMRVASRYSPSHPDVVRVEQQLKKLDPDFKGTLAKQDVALELDRTRQELDIMKERYAENHPDVVKLKQKVKHLEQQSDSTPVDSREASDVSADSDDPVYINLVGQLKSNQTELENLAKRRSELQSRLEELNNIIAQTPQVERSYRELIRERESSLVKFSELKAKAQEARLAQSLEESQKGESFTLIEPPVFPDKPEKGTRSKFILTGLAAGLLAGLGMTVLAEALDSSIRGHKALQAITGMPPLIVIPYIENDKDLLRRQRQTKLMWLGGVLLLIVTILIVHFFVMPFNEIWERLSSHLQQI
jgi:polysaccharide biosynthesis transport protein